MVVNSKNRAVRERLSCPVAEGDNPKISDTRIGLCADCSCVRKIESARGSMFYLCQRSATDSSFPKYPRLPVIQCSGYERK
jgi:hypothetical protein